MILLDTHIWRWWLNGDASLAAEHRRRLNSAGPGELGVSVISCWEMAKAVEVGKLMLSLPVEEWIDRGLRHPSVALINLTPEMAVESTRLPKPVHKDPGDQLLIATARLLNCPLMTADAKILAYPDVQHV